MWRFLINTSSLYIISFVEILGISTEIIYENHLSKLGNISHFEDYFHIRAHINMIHSIIGQRSTIIKLRISLFRRALTLIVFEIREIFHDFKEINGGRRLFSPFTILINIKNRVLENKVTNKGITDLSYK